MRAGCRGTLGGMKKRNVAEVEAPKPAIPPGQEALYKRLDEMVAQGLAKSGQDWGKPFPEEFFTKPLPKARKSVLEALLEDRDEGP